MPPIENRRSEDRIELDRVFRALGQTDRRRILLALMTDNPRWQDEFVTVEFRSDGADRETTEMELHHQHLPHLEEMGFIDWDPATGRVTRGERFEDVRPLIELMDEHREELPDGWP